MSCRNHHQSERTHHSGSIIKQVQFLAEYLCKKECTVAEEPRMNEDALVGWYVTQWSKRAPKLRAGAEGPATLSVVNIVLVE